MVSQTYTPKGRLRIASMPILWGKEWSVAKTLKDEIIAIRESLVVMNETLKELVEVKRQEVHIQDKILN